MLLSHQNSSGGATTAKRGCDDKKERQAEFNSSSKTNLLMLIYGDLCKKFQSQFVISTQKKIMQTNHSGQRYKPEFDYYVCKFLILRLSTSEWCFLLRFAQNFSKYNINSKNGNFISKCIVTL